MVLVFSSLWFLLAVATLALVGTQNTVDGLRFAKPQNNTGTPPQHQERDFEKLAEELNATFAQFKASGKMRESLLSQMREGLKDLRQDWEARKPCETTSG